MGLSIDVGILATMIEDDPDAVEWIRKDIDTINNILVSNGLPEHREPEMLPELDSRDGLIGFPYSFLHYLRRFAAHVIAHSEKVPNPVGKGEDPSKDRILDVLGRDPQYHLLYHSDSEGYYVPVDFPKVLFHEALTGQLLGSSNKVYRELQRIASPLGIELKDGLVHDDIAASIAEEEQNSNPFWVERQVWLAFYESARLSIEHNTLIVFG